MFISNIESGDTRFYCVAPSRETSFLNFRDSEELPGASGSAASSSMEYCVSEGSREGEGVGVK